MRHRRVPRLAAAACVLALALGTCGDDDGGDVDAFCAEMSALIDDDPFQALPDRATPADVRRAFDTLRDRAADIAQAATGEARPVARAWSESVAALDELLAGSNYDAPRDVVAYTQRRDRYEDLSRRLENAAAQQCPGITDE